jgi:hypothetical protein
MRAGRARLQNPRAESCAQTTGSIIMKFMMDPEWKIFADDMSDVALGKVFRCVLEYPERDCPAPLWKYIKRQIAKDKIKYDEKVARLAKNTGRDYGAASDRNPPDIAPTSEPFSSRNQNGFAATSPAIEETEYDNNKNKIERKIENRLLADSVINKVARTMNPNAAKLYEINDDFDFIKQAECSEEIADLCLRFSTDILKKGQHSLWMKRYGERLTVQQIAAWLEQEGKYGKNN